MFSMRVALNAQEHATSVAEAEEQFKISCGMCGNDPYCQWHDCDHCKLQMKHETMVAVLEIMAKYKGVRA